MYGGGQDHRHFSEIAQDTRSTYGSSNRYQLVHCPPVHYHVHSCAGPPVHKSTSSACNHLTPCSNNSLVSSVASGPATGGRPDHENAWSLTARIRSRPGAGGPDPEYKVGEEPVPGSQGLARVPNRGMCKVHANVTK